MFLKTNSQVDINPRTEGDNILGAVRVDHKDPQMDKIIIGATYIAAIKWPSRVPPASCGITAPPSSIPTLAKAILKPIIVDLSLGSCVISPAVAPYGIATMVKPTVANAKKPPTQMMVPERLNDWGTPNNPMIPPERINAPMTIHGTLLPQRE